MKKIVYIAGIEHCGSTILDIRLGSHPLIKDFGEIGTLLQSEIHNFDDYFKNYTCSCGNKMKECSFWKDTKKIFKMRI